MTNVRAVGCGQCGGLGTPSEPAFAMMPMLVNICSIVFAGQLPWAPLVRLFLLEPMGYFLSGDTRPLRFIYFCAWTPRNWARAQRTFRGRRHSLVGFSDSYDPFEDKFIQGKINLRILLLMGRTRCHLRWNNGCHSHSCARWLFCNSSR
jgi:hypothetical protein